MRNMSASIQFDTKETKLTTKVILCLVLNESRNEGFNFFSSDKSCFYKSMTYSNIKDMTT